MQTCTCPAQPSLPNIIVRAADCVRLAGNTVRLLGAQDRQGADDVPHRRSPDAPHRSQGIIPRHMRIDPIDRLPFSCQCMRTTLTINFHARRFLAS